MTSKLLIIIASGEKEKALTALMYAKNAIKYEWIPTVRVVFFGPSQNLLVWDDEVSASAADLANYTEPLACKFLSDQGELSDKTENLGISVKYVGEPISKMIRDEGFMPMVW
jgi:hypothetical protein